MPTDLSNSLYVTLHEFPEASDYWDGNWVYATIQIRAGAFRGEYEAPPPHQ